MRLEIKFDEELNPQLYKAYSQFIFRDMKKTIVKLVTKFQQKYVVREEAVLNCSLIEWKNRPNKIDLTYYIKNCLQLVKVKGVYIIMINPHLRVKHAWSSVELLVRILEYGTDKIPELPMLRRVFSYYKLNYKKMFVKFMKERYSS